MCVVDLPEKEDVYVLSALIDKMCAEKFGEENLECHFHMDLVFPKVCWKMFPNKVPVDSEFRQDMPDVVLFQLRR